MDTAFISQTKTNMSHSEAVITWTWAIIKATFATNLIPKWIASFFTVLYGIIVNWNETIVWLIFLLYFIDLFTWVASAIYRREFESRKFFMGCTKLLVYGIFAAIGVALGQTLGLGNVFLSGIFSFILITDSISILENLDKLWYATPVFLKKYLKVAQENLEKKYLPNETDRRWDDTKAGWFYWAILQSDERAYKLGSTNIEIIPSLNKKTFEYNQLEFAIEFWTNLCTLYAPIWMLSDLTWEEIPKEQRYELCKRRTTQYDWDKNIGWLFTVGRNVVRNWWNENNPNNQIREVSFEIGSKEFYDVLDKWYRINLWYRGNRKYNEDVSDWVLDSSNIGATTYGHSTTLISAVRTKNNKIKLVVDNYAWVKKFNIYSIKDFQAFLDSGIVFHTASVFIYANEKIDVEIDYLKKKYAKTNPEITFNIDKIKEYQEALKDRAN